jgi:hypothetical protein
MSVVGYHCCTRDTSSPLNPQELRGSSEQVKTQTQCSRLCSQGAGMAPLLTPHGDLSWLLHLGCSEPNPHPTKACPKGKSPLPPCLFLGTRSIETGPRCPCHLSTVGSSAQCSWRPSQQKHHEDNRHSTGQHGLILGAVGVPILP